MASPPAEHNADKYNRNIIHSLSIFAEHFYHRRPFVAFFFYFVYNQTLHILASIKQLVVLRERIQRMNVTYKKNYNSIF